jgi:hypothetical protein
VASGVASSSHLVREAQLADDDPAPADRRGLRRAIDRVANFRAGLSSRGLTDGT